MTSSLNTTSKVILRQPISNLNMLNESQVLSAQASQIKNQNKYYLMKIMTGSINL